MLTCTSEGLTPVNMAAKATLKLSCAVASKELGLPERVMPTVRTGLYSPPGVRGGGEGGGGEGGGGEGGGEGGGGEGGGGEGGGGDGPEMAMAASKGFAKDSTLTPSAAL